MINFQKGGDVARTGTKRTVRRSSLGRAGSAVAATVVRLPLPSAMHANLFGIVIEGHSVDPCTPMSTHRSMRHRYEVSGGCKHFRIPLGKHYNLHLAQFRVKFAEVGQIEQRIRIVRLKEVGKLG